jgi:hypothetical protein
VALLPVRRALEIVGKAGNVRLLPIAEGDFEHSRRFIASATQPVFFVRPDPYFLTRLTGSLCVTDLNNRTIIDNNPQLGPACVRLKT